MNNRTAKQHFFLILILGSLTALGPFSIDMYLPGFPAIAKDLHTTVARVALSLSSFFIGISAGQLLYGPLLDRFGRKKPLYIGLTLYIFASAGCVLTDSIEALIALRFIQAIGSCAAAVTSVAMVRDLFPVKDSPKIFSMLMLVVGVSPMVAPTVGGYVTEAFGWHWVFIILLVMCILILTASVLWLPESYKPDKSMSLKPGPILSNFFMVLKTPEFYTYAFTGAIAFSGLFAYISSSPMVFMDLYQVSGKTYGWIFAFLSVAFIGASQVNSRLLRYFSSEQIVLAALQSISVVGLAFAGFAVAGLLSLAVTVGFLFIYLCCLGFAIPNVSGLTMAPFSKNAGSASALMGALQMGIGAMVSVLISLISNRSTMPMAVVMAATAILSLCILLVGRKMIVKQSLMKEGKALVY